MVLESTKVWGEHNIYLEMSLSNLVSLICRYFIEDTHCVSFLFGKAFSTALLMGEDAGTGENWVTSPSSQTNQGCNVLCMHSCVVWCTSGLAITLMLVLPSDLCSMRYLCILLLEIFSERDLYQCGHKDTCQTVGPSYLCHHTAAKDMPNNMSLQNLTGQVSLVGICMSLSFWAIHIPCPYG